MSEASTVARSTRPLTIPALVEEFGRIGLREGQTVLVHSSLSSLGWVAGGPVAVIEALLLALGEAGTLVMPAHTADNTDPAGWGNPAVPESWWPAIRAALPPFEPAKTPTRGMGRIAEAFRTWPGALRSDHPVHSFAALGPQAEAITARHDLEDGLGDRSPLAALYDLDAFVLLLGVGHGNNTSLHLAEARADWPGRRAVPWGSAVLVGGERRWAEYRQLDWDAGDFEEVGRAYEASARGADMTVGRVGLAPSRFLRQRPLVDFAVEWMAAERGRGRG